MKQERMSNKQLPSDKLGPLVNSSDWLLLEQILITRRDKYIALLSHCSKDELEKLQGRVQELDYILSLRTTTK